MRLSPFLKSIGLLFPGLLGLFIGLLTMVCALPSGRIRDNIAVSAELLAEEGDYPQLGGRGDAHVLDNFTDSLMLNIVYNVNRRTPLESALLARDYYRGDPGTGELKRLVESQGARGPNRLTARYWLGWMIVLRPLLLITDYSGIRTLMGLLFALLVSAVSILLYRQSGMYVALSFPLGLALANFQIVPYNMELSITFATALVGMAFILLRPPAEATSRARVYFVLGACTIFLDFFTTPLLAFGLPAIASILMQGREKPPSSTREAVGQVLAMGLAWLAGYASMLAAKWAVASVVLGRDVFQEAALRITEITSATGESAGMFDSARLSALLSNSAILFGTGVDSERTWILLLLGAAAAALILRFSRAPVRPLRLQLLLVAVLPYAWYVLVPQHSSAHAFYTFRIQVVALFGLFCALLCTVRPPGRPLEQAAAKSGAGTHDS